MSQEILYEMMEIIKESDWMDANSKSKAIEKASNINQQIAYPDYYDNETYIETNYLVI